MADKESFKWLAVHLFYNEPWEEFLAKAVKPYVDTLVQTGIAAQFFFIRYWERGPHIRLRIKGEKNIIDNIVQPNIEEHFQVYFESKPTTRTDPSYPRNFPEHYKWYPNNSIQFIPYEREVDRFGGQVGMSLAERQFQLSSETVLRNIKHNESDWSYDEVLGIAIKLHLSFAHTMGLDIEECQSFFEIIFKNWLPRAFRFYNNKLSEALYKGQETHTIESFKKAFELQQDSLVPFHQVLWDALESDGEFDDKELSKWINAHQELENDFRIALALDQLEPRAELYQLKMADSYSAERKLLWAIFSDFIHLTNNRLGISNRDEGYLAYLICESLKQIASKTTDEVPLKKWKANN